MASPEYQWAADPNLVVASIKMLAGVVFATGGSLIGVLLWIWNKTDAKVERMANSLESLTLTTSTKLAAIEATCKANHSAHP